MKKVIIVSQLYIPRTLFGPFMLYVDCALFYKISKCDDMTCSPKGSSPVSLKCIQTSGHAQEDDP